MKYSFGLIDGWECSAKLWVNEVRINNDTMDRAARIDQVDLMLVFTKDKHYHRYHYKIDSTICCVKTYSHLTATNTLVPSRVVFAALQLVRYKESRHKREHAGYKLIEQFTGALQPQHTCKRDPRWDSVY